MNETNFDETDNSDDELEAEYNFYDKKAKPNRFAVSAGKQRLKVVVLDEDVARVFTTSESVNKALRALIESRPQAANDDTA